MANRYGLGNVGVWLHPSAITPRKAAELEQLGYGTVWLGASPAAELSSVDPLLAATTTLSVGTSIVNVSDRRRETGRRVVPPHRGGFSRPIHPGHRSRAPGERERLPQAVPGVS